jgi:hypothetical protein
MKQVNNFRIFESKENTAKAICYYNHGILLGAELIHDKFININEFSTKEDKIQSHIDKYNLSDENNTIYIPDQLLNPIN